jgi:hypothetical protein
MPLAMVSEKYKRFLRNIIFMFRMTRAKSLIAGPHTYTFLLLRNLVVDRPKQQWVLFAYAVGVCLMEVVHRSLVYYRKVNGGGRSDEVENRKVHEYAATATNAAYLSISTVQLLHVTGMHQPFVVTFILLILRVQQTLGGGRRSALFSGPIMMIAVTLLCILALLSREHEFTLPTPGSPYTNKEHGPSADAVVLLCVAVGASAHAHLQWVVLHEHNNELYMWDKGVVVFMTFISHLALACVSAFVAAFHPIMVDINMVMLNPNVEMLLPRLTLTVIVLLLCTAPICDSTVLHTLLGDGSVIIATVLVTQAHPAMGSVVTITVAVSVSILSFCFVYIRCDEWPWRRWCSWCNVSHRKIF